MVFSFSLAGKARLGGILGNNEMIRNISKTMILAMMFLTLFASLTWAARIKDMASLEGVRTNQLVGYGLVVGLDGTGDQTNTLFTVQSLVNMLQHMGIQVDPKQVKVKNVAAVMVTADMPPFARIGNRIDVMVSSAGDAKSLVGGTLLLTPLKGVDGKVYGLAQGPLVIGGIGASGAGQRVAKNHLQVGRIANGASVEREIPMALNEKNNLTLTLFNPDFITATRMSDAINKSMGPGLARALDSGTLTVAVPPIYKDRVASFVAAVESLDVTPDEVAKIVVNEKTGTVVIGENVRISTVAISHGNLSITVTETPQVSQPGPLSSGRTKVTPQTNIQVKEQEKKVLELPAAATIGDLVRGLNAMGVTPRDLISVLQTIKAAGALQAELEII
jgi:flagellar P-ring protein precursor FlgI